MLNTLKAEGTMDTNKDRRILPENPEHNPTPMERDISC